MRTDIPAAPAAGIFLSGKARGARKKRLANPGDLCYLALCRKRMSLKESSGFRRPEAGGALQSHWLLTFLLYRTGRWKKKASAVLEASDC